MPAAVEYVRSDTTSTNQQQLEDAFSKELSARQTALEKQWDYYNGKQHRHLQRDNTGTDDNVTVNMVGLAIDKGVSALVGGSKSGEFEGVAFEISDQPADPGYTGATVGGADRAQQWIDMVLRENNIDVLLHNAALNGALGGQVFIKVIPDGRKASDTDQPLPRLVNRDCYGVLGCIRH